MIVAWVMLMGLNKYKTIGFNFLVSQIIIAIFLIFAWAIWYPSPLAEFSGFYKMSQIILLTNLCLGPILIFIIYKEHKKKLKQDLLVLAIIQVSAFLFGAYSIYLKHPAYLVFTVDRFTLVSEKEITSDKIQYPQLQTSFFSSPKLVFAQRPENPKARNELLFSVLFEGKPDLDRRAEYYEPFANHLTSVLKRSIETDVLFPDELSQIKLSKFLGKYGGEKQDYAYLPLQGNRGKNVIWVLDRKDGHPIDIIDSDPWLVANK